MFLSNFSADGWISFALLKLNVSIRPVRPVWYCRQVSGGLIKLFCDQSTRFPLQIFVDIYLLGLLHSTCVTLMSHCLAVVVSEKVKARVAVLPAVAPMST